MLKAVIFDMDGVIIDSEPIHKEVERKIFKKIGVNISDEEHNSYVGRTSMSMWSEIKSKYNLGQCFSIKQILDMEINNYIDHILSCENIRPIKGVVEFLDELYEKDVKLALASSGVRKSIETVVEMFKLDKYFQIRISGEDIKNGKPSPDIFLKAAEYLRVFPNECTVVEDSTNGVQAAKKAGMKCVGFRNLNSGDQDLSCADIIINSYSDTSYKKICSLW